jgi:hypothetical protein
MHGFHPSLKHETEQRLWPSEWNFGLIALLVLSALAIAASLLMPEFTL